MINAATATLSATAMPQAYASGNLLQGGWTITFSPVTPLKKLNNTTPTNNTLQLVGSGALIVNKTNTNELTVDLDIEDPVLNVKRTTHYE